jgi:hypothetical protein
MKIYTAINERIIMGIITGPPLKANSQYDRVNSSASPAWTETVS